jgi:aminoglycoside 6'-N-acetyltransferase I
MNFVIRKMDISDCAAWIDMRTSLWPHDSASLHAQAVEAILADDEAWGFIAESPEGAPAAFAEVAIRKYANGCDSEPVPFLEGIFVRPEFRRQGAGARLIAQVEGFLTARGFNELGSDALIDNLASQAAHRVWGFTEMERVVCFRKLLNHSAAG